LSRGHGVLGLFWEGSRTVVPRPILLSRELITQVAALTDLHLDYGWPLEQITWESDDFAFDLEVRADTSDASEMLIAVEAKSTRRSLERMMAEVRACGMADPHARTEYKRPGHQKYAGWFSMVLVGSGQLPRVSGGRTRSGLQLGASCLFVGLTFLMPAPDGVASAFHLG
jgi:hypothetical protein